MQSISHLRNPNKVSEEKHSWFKSNMQNIETIKELDRNKGLFVSKINGQLFFTRNKRISNNVEITLLDVKSSRRIIYDIKRHAMSFAKNYSAGVIYNAIKDWLEL